METGERAPDRQQPALGMSQLTTTRRVVEG
jgi:hypothetical protein